MSVRRPDEDHELGNRLATLLVALPIAEPDPVARLELIHAYNDQAQGLRAGIVALSLVIEGDRGGLLRPTINRVLADAIPRPLSWNPAANVPGPQVPLLRARRRIEAIYPFVPLSPQNHALSIGVLSYDGGVFFGLAGDRDVLADIDALAADLEAALAEQAAAPYRAAPSVARRARSRARDRCRRPGRESSPAAANGLAAAVARLHPIVPGPAS